ncbi:acyltransferase [Pedobacter changchengzhani]|uniref:Acyltransferase n=1 Tax=Pedobacter changchengzhani TaxID=2529274 RepID=A0A4R5MJP9_9SPHI|nr:acyltransferase [Pedobacter changchengzhani]TDG35309.1 acyltransferase [Pedobacter changchengzhani]
MHTSIAKIEEKINTVNQLLSYPLTTPDFLNKKYYPSLDGWRAIAITLVVLGHAGSSSSPDSGYYIIAKIFFSGLLGVKIFFVLSGFLITSLLIKEKIKYGSINVKNFFIKRGLRILPVLYLYLLIVFILNNKFDFGLNSIGFLGPALYVTNFGFFPSSWVLVHTWTLSVEEQFYMLWPFIFRLNKYAIYICIIIICLSPILKPLTYKFPSLNYLLLQPFFNSATSIFTGSLSAFLIFNKHIFKRLIITKVMAIIAFIFLCVYAYSLSLGIFGKFNLTLGELVANFSIMYLIIATIVKHDHFLFKVLNTQLFIKLGTISYSLYIWQQLFLFPLGIYPNWSVYVWFPINIIFAVLAALVSYYFFEKYFLNLKNKLLRDT